MFNSQNHWRKKGEDGRAGEMLQSVETLRCKQKDPSSGIHCLLNMVVQVCAFLGCRDRMVPRLTGQSV